MNLLTAATPWDYAVFTRASAPTNTPRYSTSAGVRGILVENPTQAGAGEFLKIPIASLDYASGTFEMVFSYKHASDAYGRLFNVGVPSVPPFSDDCIVVRRDTAAANKFQLVGHDAGGSAYTIISLTMTADIVTDRRYYLALTMNGTALALTARDLVSKETVTGSATLPRTLDFSDETYVFLGGPPSGTSGFANIAIEEARFSVSVRSATELAAGGTARLALDAYTSCLLMVPANGEALAVRWGDIKSVQFPTAAARPGSRSDQLRQIKERDSSGNVYVYGKGLLRRVVHQLSWPRVSETVKTRLETLLGTHADGSRYPMVWVDHELESRTVKLEGGQVGFEPAGGGNWRAAFGVFEEVA